MSARVRNVDDECAVIGAAFGRSTDPFWRALEELVPEQDRASFDEAPAIDLARAALDDAALDPARTGGLVLFVAGGDPRRIAAALSISPPVVRIDAPAMQVVAAAIHAIHDGAAALALVATQSGALVLRTNDGEAPDGLVHGAVRAAPGSAHVDVIPRLPGARVDAPSPPDAGALVIALTASSRPALADLATRLADRLEARPALSLADVARTCWSRGQRGSVRFASVARDRGEAIASLRRAAGAVRPPTRSDSPRIAFLFSGQGSQWPAMGQRLLHLEPFRDALERCGRVTRDDLGWSVLDVVRDGSPDVGHGRADLVQPLLVAIQISLAAQWQAWGLAPAAVLGQSIGEVSAAAVAGVLSLESAMRMICARSRLVGRLSGTGAMALIELSFDEATELLARGEHPGVAVAADHSPSTVLVSGPRESIERIRQELSRRDLLFRWVDIDYASHGPDMDPMMPELRAALASLPAGRAAIPIYSTAELRTFAPGETVDLDYWARNERVPVLLRPAVERMIEADFDAFLEVSAHPVLLPWIERTFEAKGRRCPPALPSLRRGEDDQLRMAESLASLFMLGCDVSGEQLAAGGRAVRLPVAVAKPDAPDGARGGASATAARAPWREQLLATASLVDRRHALETWIAESAAAIIGVPAGEVAHDRSFKDLGFDSLRLLRLQAALAARFGVELSIAAFFRHSTLGAIAAAVAAAADVPLGIASAPRSRAAIRSAGQSTGSDDEPIAVIGMACRFPGANSPAAFWDLLMEGRDAIREIPADRWDAERMAESDPAFSHLRWGGFVDQVDQFEPTVFGLSAREATWMDPQQRLVLEVAWEALEDAAIPHERIANTSTGVFIGVHTVDYVRKQPGDLRALDAYSWMGVSPNMLAGRLSYLLDLHGPALVLDTACSSALVALHYACDSLRRGDAEIALAGGVNVLLTPELFASGARMRLMAQDGRCKTFDARADGYVRGEGCGLVLLKRLSDAVAAGDRVLAVVRGSGINQDGRSNGITAPNGEAQAALLRDVLAKAAIAPGQVEYIETHGTGTAIGDPIELEALSEVYGAPAGGRGRCVLGAVKTNIGHLESAAGVAGFMKVVLTLVNGIIPRNLHFQTLNPHVSLDGTRLRMPTQALPWARGQRPRLAGINSFGWSGTNAHAILEEAPPASAAGAQPEDGGPQLLVVSSKTPEGLRAQARRLAEHLAAHEEDRLIDVACTLSTGRSHWQERLALVASTAQEARAGLERFAAGETETGILAAKAEAGAQRKLAWLFSGQGSQYGGMGRELYATESVYRAAIDRCEEILKGLLEPSLTAFLADGALLDRTMYTQPGLFSLEYALSELWRSWGIVPDAVMGHSVGEYVAACVAGVFDLEDGLRLCAARGRLMQALDGEGAMASARCQAERVQRALEGEEGKVSIAAYNGPQQIVVSGERPAVEAVCRRLEADGVKTTRLQVSHAFHSPLMDPMLDAFEAEAARLRMSAPRLALVSNLTGRMATEEVATPGYWRRHVREAVQFEAGMQALREGGFTSFLEIGPHPTLLGMGSACLGEGHGEWLPSLRKNRDPRGLMLETLGRLHVRGAAVNWRAYAASRGGRRIGLPTYAFQRQRYWVDAGRARRDEVGEETGHPLLGTRLRLAGSDAVFETTLEGAEYLTGHRIFGDPVLPATAYLEMAHAAVRAKVGDGGGACCVRDLVLQAPLRLDEQGHGSVQVVVSEASEEGGGWRVRIFSEQGQGGEGWKLHAEGRVEIEGDDRTAERADVGAIRSRSSSAIDVDERYAALAEAGLAYGGAFVAMRALQVGDGESLAELELPEQSEGEASQYGLHPALLDAALHAIDALAAGRGGGKLPFEVGEYRIFRSGASCARVHARWKEGGASGGELADVRLYDDEGLPIAEIVGLRLKPAQAAGAPGAGALETLYRLEWQEGAGKSKGTGAGAGDWVVVTRDGAGLAAAIAKRLAEAGGRCRVVAGAADLDEQPADGVVCVWGGGALGRTPAEEAEALSADGLAVVQRLLGQSRAKTPRLWWVTEGAQGLTDGEPVRIELAALWGLGRVVMSEHPELGCALVDVEGGDPDGAAGAVVGEILAGEDETQVAYRGGKRYLARLTKVSGGSRLQAPEAESYRLETKKKGELDQLWLAPTPRQPVGPGEVEIAVKATGMNFRDVLNALGMYPGDPGPLGNECAGVVTQVGEGVERFSVGQPVMALARGSFGRYVTVDARMVAPVPHGLTLEQAATVPIVYLTAWYGLRDLGRLQPGQRILIHAAAGGVGMAAVQIAQWIGAEVYGTASRPKWNIVKAQGVWHVSDSRTLAFVDDFKQATRGRGFDVVLNALAREFVDASLSLLAPGGRFLEIGKTDVRPAAEVARSHPGIEYHPYDLMEVNPDRLVEMFGELREGFESKKLRVLPVRTYALTDAEEAFRYMAQARHVGKLAIKIGADTTDGTVLITGGLGALGLHVARWLARERGVKHLLLVGRRAPTAEQQAEVERLRATGAEVTTAQVDVAEPSQVTALLAAIAADRPLRGVVHAAGLLRDGVIAQQDEARFREVFRPKVLGAWTLHQATRELPLDFFVTFSSVAAVFGSAGQANYAAANAFLDGLAKLRRAQGLAGLSLNWGPWAEGGMADRLDPASQARFGRLGMAPFAAEDGLRQLGRALDRPDAGLVPVRLDVKALQRSFGSGAIPPLWRALVTAPVRSTARSASGARGFAARLAELGPAARKPEMAAMVRAEVARVLSVPATSEIAAERPLKDLGLDSLMAVELRNALASRVGTALPASLAFDYPTVSALTDRLLEVLPASSAAPAPARPAAPLPPSAPADRDEPIAIVGIGCRFPGGVVDADSFWTMLAEGRDAIGEMPRERWDVDALYDPDPEAPGKMITRNGGFLPNVDRFDAAFFGIAPREADKMDPQQRLLLEVSWEALEHAGYPQEKLADSATGVFVGVIYHEYGELWWRDLERLDGYTGTGTQGSVASGRISYALGLRGPSITVDTACSSSLVAIHLACSSLRSGECDTALAGGATVMLTPRPFVEFSRLRGLAPDGRCKTFDASADGVAWGEGCGVVVLKRLSAARRDGDRVLAVIAGSAVNQDGRSNGLTAPNGPSQEMVIRRALEQAGVGPAEVGYVEAHGTGTSLGDPIELQAIGAVMGRERAPERPVVVGSVKSNLGHAQAAAGVAGVIKTVLALQHGHIPRSLHFTEPTPQVDWSGLPIQVAREMVAWPACGPRRIAGVSSFGMSGTNAHLILEEAQPAGEEAAVVPAPRAELFVLSAKSADGLAEQARNHVRLFDSSPDLSLSDACFTATARRSHHAHRLALVAESRQQVQNDLEAFLRGETRPLLSPGVAREGGGKIAFVFPGQGGQWIGMGRALLVEEPAFGAVIEACQGAMGGLTDWSLPAVLRGEGPDADLERVDVVQPALFAMQVGLAAVWRAWGVEPSAVVGHSMGEIAAAQVAGAISLEDACRIICVRSQLVRRASGQGGMLVVELPVADAEAALAPFAGRVSVAAVNSPRTTVLSGERDALARIAAALDARAVFCRWIKVDYASHSPQMRPLAEELLARLGEVRVREGTVPLYSTVSGALGETRLTADYWERNLRERVLFWPAVEALAQSGIQTFVELNGHPILLPSIDDGLRATVPALLTVPSLRRDGGGRQALLGALGQLWAHGHPIDWAAQHLHPGRVISLPSYPWQRSRHWVEESDRRRPRAPGGHPLMGVPLTVAETAIRFWQTELDLSDLPYLRDHRVETAVVFPGAAYVEMAMAAGKGLFGDTPFVVDGLELHEMLSLTEETTRTVQVTAADRGDGSWSLRVATRGDGGSWTSHAAATLRPATAGAPVADLAAARQRCATPVDRAQQDAELRRRGLEYGDAFSGLARAWSGNGEAVGEIELPRAAGEASGYTAHPALIDACLQAMLAALPAGNQDDGPVLPTGVRAVRRFGAVGRRVSTHVRVTDRTDRGVQADVFLFDEQGRPVLELSGVTARRLGGTGRGEERLFLMHEWRAAPAAPSAPSSSTAVTSCLLLADEGGTGRRVAQALEQRGVRVQCAWALDPALASRAGVEALLARGPFQAVVHLWSLDGPAAAMTDLAGLERAQVRDCGSTLHLVQAIAAAQLRDAPRLWLVTSGAHGTPGSAGVESAGDAPAASMLWGMGRTIATEHPELRATRVDIDAAADEAGALVHEIVADGPEEEILLRGDGRRFVGRLVRRAPDRTAREVLVPADGQPVRLEIDQPGALDRLVLRRSARRPPSEDEVEIEVQAVGLNAWDLSQALGPWRHEPGEGNRPPLGFECAGRVVAVGAGVAGLSVGQEVLAIAPGALASFVTTPALLAVPRPAALTAAQAATLPLAHLTAYHALAEIARLSAGERVLIHAAHGQVGQVAIQWALHVGAEVFATAGTDAQRELVRSLGVARVSDAGRADFAGDVRSWTGGEGVDVVLSSASGPPAESSFGLLREGGQFVDIGRRANGQPGPRPFLKNVSYTTVDLVAMAERRPTRIRALFERVMQRIEEGALRPLPHRSFPIRDAEQAFRAAGHLDKVVVTVGGESQRGARVRVRADAGAAIRSDATYLVTGGLGGLGLAVARGLVERGARHLVLVGRRGAEAAAQKQAVAALAGAGARVVTAAANVASPAELQAVFARIGAEGLPPLRGIVHAAGLLADGLLLQQDLSRFETVMAPKVAGAWNLHALTKDLELDFFVLYSSGASLLGSPGQGNYAAANAFMDGLAHHRRALGLPALSINWGAFSDVGLAAAEENRAKRLALQGLRSLTADEGLALLFDLVAANEAQVGVVPIDARHWVSFAPHLARSTLLSDLLRDGGGGGGDGALRKKLTETEEPARTALLTRHLVEQIGQVTRRDPRQIEASAPFKSLGIDSLMGLELRNRLEAALNLKLSATVVWTYPTAEALARHLASKLGPAVVVVAPGPAVVVPELSQEETERQLEERLAALEDRLR